MTTTILPNGRDSYGRFLPGVSGNQSGAVSGPSLSRVLREWFTTHPDDLLAFIEAGVKLALKGKFEFYNLIWNRLDGKLIETHQIDSENPVTLVFMPYAEAKRIGNISEPPVLEALEAEVVVDDGLEKTSPLCAVSSPLKTGLATVARPEMPGIPQVDHVPALPPNWTRTKIEPFDFAQDRQ